MRKYARTQVRKCARKQVFTHAGIQLRISAMARCSNYAMTQVHGRYTQVCTCAFTQRPYCQLPTTTYTKDTDKCTQLRPARVRVGLSTIAHAGACASTKTPRQDTPTCAQLHPRARVRVGCPDRARRRMGLQRDTPRCAQLHPARVRAGFPNSAYRNMRQHQDTPPVHSEMRPNYTPRASVRGYPKSAHRRMI